MCYYLFYEKDKIKVKIEINNKFNRKKNEYTLDLLFFFNNMIKRVEFS